MVPYFSSGYSTWDLAFISAAFFLSKTLTEIFLWGITIRCLISFSLILSMIFQQKSYCWEKLQWAKSDGGKGMGNDMFSRISLLKIWKFQSLSNPTGESPYMCRKVPYDQAYHISWFKGSVSVIWVISIHSFVSELKWC